MHEVLVNRLGSLSLPRKSVVRLTDRPDMTLDVYRGRKTTMQQQQQLSKTFIGQTWYLLNNLPVTPLSSVDKIFQCNRSIVDQKPTGSIVLKF